MSLRRLTQLEVKYGASALVTAVASFYFGTKATGVADVAGSKPILRGISPTNGARGTQLDLEISGDHLEHVLEAKVTQGARQVIATDITSSASRVKCRVTVPASDPAGAWTVMVSDAAGQVAQLTNALTLS